MKIYETHMMNDPRLPFIFHETRFSGSRHSSTEGNWHENVEILCFTDGTGTVRLNDVSISVTEGDIIIANSNCLHRIESHTTLAYYCLIVDRSFCIANHFDTNLMHFEEHIRDAEIEALMAELSGEFANIRSNGNKENFAILSIRAKVLLIMSILCRSHTCPDVTGQTDAHLVSCVKQAIGFIHTNIDRDVSLEKTAEFVGLSQSYFARQFKRITGYTFISYVNLVRCKKAKRMLLETQKSIGEISAECGFSDQSYFTKVFKKRYGILPAEQRRLKGCE